MRFLFLSVHVYIVALLHVSMASSKSFIKANSCTEPTGSDGSRLDAPEDHFGPLSNVR